MNKPWRRLHERMTLNAVCESLGTMRRAGVKYPTMIEVLEFIVQDIEAGSTGRLPHELPPRYRVFRGDEQQQRLPLEFEGTNPPFKVRRPAVRRMERTADHPNRTPTFPEWNEQAS